MVFACRCVIVGLIMALTPGVSHLNAQENWGAFNATVSVEKYRSHRFRISSMIRTEINDDSSAVRLWLRQDKPGGAPASDNKFYEPIRSDKWEKFSSEGSLDSTTNQLSFGALTEYNGKFFIDDLRIEVDTAAGAWITVYKNDFESPSALLKPGIGVSNVGVNTLFKAAISSTHKTSGSKSLVIDGVSVPNYGINRQAGRFANVNGIKLYYEIYGKGTPLVILHGNGGSIASAGTYIGDLKKKYKVIAIDSRAQGRSGDNGSPLTYDLMASDVNELLKQLKIDSALIWGQSDGAILGLLLAMDHPVKVRKVVAFGANIQPDSTAIFDWAIKDMIKTIEKNEDPVAVKLNTLMRDYPNIPYERLQTIKVPILVAAGDRDVIRPEHTLRIFQHIPNSHMFIVPGATHGAAWEKKEMFLKIMMDFFDKPFAMPDTRSWFN